MNEEYFIKNEGINIKLNNKESIWIYIKDSNIYTTNCYDSNIQMLIIQRKEKF